MASEELTGDETASILDAESIAFAVNRFGILEEQLIASSFFTAIEATGSDLPLLKKRNSNH